MSRLGRNGNGILACTKAPWFAGFHGRCSDCRRERSECVFFDGLSANICGPVPGVRL